LIFIGLLTIVFEFVPALTIPGELVKETDVGKIEGSFVLFCESIIAAVVPQAILAIPIVGRINFNINFVRLNLILILYILFL
jgi:hypothetical protein